MTNLTEWVQVSADHNPQVGQTIRKVPELAVHHPDGSGHMARLEELGECVGVITRVGAHYSEPGRSGWWCEVSYDVLERIATEFERVFGSPATAELHGGYVLVNVEAWPERALYRGALALETLSRYADGHGASVEGDSEVCAALEASGAFVALEVDHA